MTHLAHIGVEINYNKQTVKLHIDEYVYCSLIQYVWTLCHNLIFTLAS